MHIVTGGAGFIGSHLVDALVTRGDLVKIVDNFSRGSLGNLEAATQTGRVEVLNLDLETYQFPCGPNDVVWHFAAKVAAIEYNRKNQYEMLRANLAINYHAIESARKQKPKLFVFTSTACAYPADAPVPTPESAGDICNPEKTNHGYAVAKWTGEQMVKHLAREHNVPCLIVRLFNAIGPRDYYDKETSHVVPALIRRVMEGENPLLVWGSGQQTRVFVDARDIAKALVMLADCAEAHNAQPINIGHEREVSIAQLVDDIVRLCGKNVGYEFNLSKPDGHKRRAADTTMLRSLIVMGPDRPLVGSLSDMVAEFREGRAHL